MPLKRRRNPELVREGRYGSMRWFASAMVLVLSFFCSLKSHGAGAGTAPTVATSTSAPAVNLPAATATGNIGSLLVKLADADAAAQLIFEELARTGDPRLETVFADFNEGSLYVWKGRAVTCKKLEDEGDAKVAPLRSRR